MKDVAHATWFGGIYQDPKNFFAQFAIVPDDWLRMYPEFVVPDDQWEAFKADRQGCVVGRKLAERFGWKVGDRIPMQGASFMGGGSWDFNVRGIYHGTRRGDDEMQFWMRHDYLVEKGPEFWRGIVGWYVVRITNPDSAPAVAKLIDEEFANSSSETRTQTESAFAASMVKQMGNIEFLILAIGSVVFFTLLLVTGNTMAISVRERTNELAVLKAIGYSDTFVLSIVLAESLLISAIGGVVGLWLASMLVKLDLTQGLLLMYLPPIAFVLGALIALGDGLPRRRAAGAERDAAERRQRAAEDLTWRSRSSTTCAASRSAGRRRSLPSSASPAPWRCSWRCSRWRAASRWR